MSTTVQASSRRIYAMVLRHTYLLRKSWIRVVETAYWPTMNMILWGFIAKYLATQSTQGGWMSQVPGLLISALLLWELLFRGQLNLALAHKMTNLRNHRQRRNQSTGVRGGKAHRPPVVGIARPAKRDQWSRVNQNAFGPDLHAGVLCAAEQHRMARCRRCRTRYRSPSFPPEFSVYARWAASRAASRAPARPDQMHP